MVPNFRRSLKVIHDMRGDGDRNDRVHECDEAQGQVERQTRPGTHHGHGGRRRQNEVEMGRIQKGQIGHVMSNLILLDTDTLYWLRHFWIVLVVVWDIFPFWWRACGPVLSIGREMKIIGETHEVKWQFNSRQFQNLLPTFKSMLCLQPRKVYEVSQGPVLVIRSKWAQWARAGVGNVMERYTSCTWIDWKGGGALYVYRKHEIQSCLFFSAWTVGIY